MFRDRIKAKYEELSSNSRRLADFFLQQQLEASYMTTTELAERMGMNAATVVRFAQTLGYSGFREMIKEVQRTIKEEMSASHAAASGSPGDAKLFHSLLEKERRNLARTQARLTEQVDVILPALKNARRIWVMGQGYCSPLADLCAAALRGLELPAASISPDPTEAAENLKETDADDLLIGFSLTGMDLGVGDAIRFARQQGAKTLAFSGSTVTAAARAAEVSVICPGSTQAPTPSFTGLAAMIAALVAAFAARYPERATAAQARLQQSYRQILTLRAQSLSEMDIESLYPDR